MPDTDIDDSFTATAVNSFNDDVTNDLDVDVAVADAFNDDNSTNDSGNLTVGVADSFNEDSHDVDMDVDWDVEDSFNEETDSSVDDHSDNSIEDSYNTSTDDSYNTTTVTLTDDHSVNAGNREYNTGFGDVMVGGSAAAAATAATGGDLFIDGRSLIVDNSVNQNIDAGFVGQDFETSNVIAGGDDSMAAGGDIDIDTDIDTSTSIFAGGDVNIGNETSITATVGSYNTFTDNSTVTENDLEVDIEDSWNDYSDTYTATDSFNTAVDYDETTTVDLDVDAIVDSDDALIADDLDIAF